jgi:hypothetical protein
MMGGLNFKAHTLQGFYHIPAGIFPFIHRRQVEIPGFVSSLNRRLAIIIYLK